MGIFDINHKNKCPLCGKNMDYIYGDMVCSECGYRASYSASSISDKTTASAQASKKNTGTAASQNQAAAPKISYTYTGSRATPPKSNKSSFGKRGVPLLVIAVFLIIGAVMAFSFSAIRRAGSVINDFVSYEESLQSTNPLTFYDEFDFSALPDTDSQEAASYDDTVPTDINLENNSDGILEVIGLIFGKDASTVTPQELSSVEYLDFYYDNNGYKAVTYGIASDNDFKDYYDIYPSDTSFYSTDFSIFPNLDTLYMEYGSIGSLQGLEQLCVIGTDMTPSEIAQLINPEQLYSLTLTDLFNANDLSGIEQFKNVSRLFLSADYVENIDLLSKLTNLDTLMIFNGDNINSFQILYEMPQLECLYLDCPNLSDIGFVSNMPLLNDLSIWNSKLKDVDALKNCSDSIKYLDLSYNYEITNYDAVSALTNLETLSLYVDYSFDEPIQLPQLGSMQNLTSLLLGNFEDFHELKNASGLQSLTIYGTYAHDFSALTALKNLNSLVLYNMSLAPSALESVMELTNLTYISLDGSYIFGNVEGLLKLPNLKEFHMADCTAGFDITNLSQNPSIELIDLSHSQLHELKNGNWDYNDETNILALAENTDILKNYQGLRKLYVAEHEIDNIQFAASLPHLEVLDITDNYVTDLTPLAILPNLQYVICHNNPINNDGGLGYKVIE